MRSKIENYKYNLYFYRMLKCTAARPLVELARRTERGARSVHIQPKQQTILAWELHSMKHYT